MKRNFLLLVGFIFLASLLFSGASFAAVTVSTQLGTTTACAAVNGAGPSIVNREGLAEEGADVVLAAAAPGDFNATNTNNANVYTVTFTGGVAMTSPVSSNGSPLPVPGNVEVCDGGAPTLAISNPTVQFLVSQGGTTVAVSFTVTTTNANATAKVVLRNLRWNIAGSQLLGNGTTNLQVTTATAGAVALGGTPANVATPLDTVNGVGAIVPSGAGAVSGVGAGLQSSGAALKPQSWITFTEGAVGLFRAANTANTTTGDIATGATTLQFVATNIPTGVSVTFPSSLTGSAGTGNPSFVFSNPSAPSSTTNGGNLSVAYQLTAPSVAANGPGAFTLGPGGTTVGNSITTAGANPTAPNPIVVTIGSASGFGTASIQVLFGPQDPTNTAIPRYATSTKVSVPATAGTAGSGILVGTGAGGNNFGAGGPVNWFVVTPVQTNIIVPWAGNVSGYQTGIAVANTGLDNFAPGGTSAATGQTGVLTVEMVPSSGGLPFGFTTSGTIAPGTGLSAAGTLLPGSTWAVTVSELLAASGQAATATFQGYILIQTQFQYAHASVFWFAPNGSVFNVPAIEVPPGQLTGGRGANPTVEGLQ